MPACSSLILMKVGVPVLYFMYAPGKSVVEIGTPDMSRFRRRPRGRDREVTHDCAPRREGGGGWSDEFRGAQRG